VTIASGDDVQWLLPDYQGNIVAATDAVGTLAGRLNYDTFGKLIAPKAPENLTAGQSGQGHPPELDRYRLEHQRLPD
jgi:hypothetical protein